MAQFKNRHLSASRLKLWQECPAAWRAKYVEGQSDPTDFGETAAVGTAVHRAAEMTTRAVIAGRLPNAPAERTLRGRLELRTWLHEADLTPAQYEDANELVSRWGGSEDLGSAVGAEQELRIDLGPWPLIGYIDRIDVLSGGVVEVIDYKTTRSIPRREELDASLQAVLYVAWARQEFPWAARWVARFVYLRHGVSMRTEPDADTCDRYLEWARAAGERSETGPWPARPGGQCAWCPVRWDCKALQSASGKAPRSVEELAMQREQAAALEKMIKRRKTELDDALRARIAEEGEVSVGGVHYSLRSVGYDSYDVGQLLAALSFASGESEAEVARAVLKIQSGKAVREWAEAHGAEYVLESLVKRRAFARLDASRREGPE